MSKTGKLKCVVGSKTLNLKDGYNAFIKALENYGNVEDISNNIITIKVDTNIKDHQIFGGSYYEIDNSYYNPFYRTKEFVYYNIFLELNVKLDLSYNNYDKTFFYQFNVKKDTKFTKKNIISWITTDQEFIGIKLADKIVKR